MISFRGFYWRLLTPAIIHENRHSEQRGLKKDKWSLNYNMIGKTRTICRSDSTAALIDENGGLGLGNGRDRVSYDKDSDKGPIFADPSRDMITQAMICAMMQIP